MEPHDHALLLMMLHILHAAGVITDEQYLACRDEIDYVDKLSQNLKEGRT